MKKVLLGSTALIAATTLISGGAAASDPISLSVGGYMVNAMTVTSISSDTGTGGVREGFHQLENAEIQFTGSTTLDNGINIGVNIQFEAESANTGDTTDEAYIEISSDSAGMLLLGSENLPDYKMHYGAPTLSMMGFNSTFIGGLWNPNPTGSGGNNNTLGGGTGNRFNANDPQHIAYYSPRISGVQFGIGYAPDTSQGNAFGGTYQNGVSGGLNYRGDFDGFGINASLSGMVWGEAPTTAAANTRPLGDNDDATIVRGGINFTYAGATLGGSFADMDNKLGATAANGLRSSDGQAWDIAASYASGPWAVSIGYAEHDQEGLMNAGNTADDELQMVDLSGTYSLGPGVSLIAGIMRSEWTGETLGEADDRTAVTGWLGISLGF